MNFLSVFKNNFTLKTRPKNEVKQSPKTIKIYANYALGCAVYQKSLKPESSPSMVHFSTKAGKLNNFTLKTMGLGKHKIVLLLWWKFNI